MASQVVAFLRRSPRRGTDWSQAEIAELYRIEHALLQARFSLETDRGVSDEGDPWFVFCRADGEVLVHITRSDEGYLLYGLGLPHPLTGRVIGDISKSFVNQIPLNIPRQTNGPQLFVHPAATLAIIVGMIFLANDDVSLVASAQAETASGSGGAEPAADRSVKASVLALLGKLGDGTLFGGTRLETNNHDGNYLNIVCTIAAVMMGTAVALDVAAENFNPLGPDTAVVADGEPTQAAQAPSDVTDIDVAMQVEASVGDPLADQVTALSSDFVAEDAPLVSTVAAGTTIETYGTQQLTAVVSMAANFEPAKGDLAIDEAVFGLPGPMPYGEGRGPAASTHSVVAPADFAPPSETAPEGTAKEAASPVEPKVTHAQHEDAGTISAVSSFHDLFKSVGLSEHIQVERVVAHATLEILESFVEPVISIVQDQRTGAAETKGDVVAGTKGDADVGATAPHGAGSNALPVFDLAAREILFHFFQVNPNAQAVFYDGNAIVYDADESFGAEHTVVKVWEFDTGATITLVGHADDLVAHAHA